MKRTLVTWATLGLAAAAAPAAAQMGAAASVVGPQIGIHGGLSLPQSDYKDLLDNGFIVGGHLALNPAMLPVGIRLSVNYEKYNVKDEYASFLGSDASASVWSGDLDAILKFPGVLVSPYVVGGVTFDHLKSYGGSTTETGLEQRVRGAADDSNSENKFGAGVGGGVMFHLAGFSTFVEAKYRMTFTEDVKFKRVPVVFGVSFGL